MALEHGLAQGDEVVHATVLVDHDEHVDLVQCGDSLHRELVEPARTYADDPQALHLSSSSPSTSR
jgi:hypothetical protein